MIRRRRYCPLQWLAIQCAVVDLRATRDRTTLGHMTLEETLRRDGELEALVEQHQASLAHILEPMCSLGERLNLVSLDLSRPPISDVLAVKRPPSARRALCSDLVQTRPRR